MNPTCKDCGKRIYWIVGMGAWYHWTLSAMLDCPAETVEPAEAAV